MSHIVLPLKVPLVQMLAWRGINSRFINFYHLVCRKDILYFRSFSRKLSEEVTSDASLTFCICDESFTIFFTVWSLKKAPSIPLLGLPFEKSLYLAHFF